jgi:hypothetical protein
VITFKAFVNEVTQLDSSKIVNGQVPDNLMRPIDRQGNRLVGSAAAAFERAQRDCQASVGKPLTLAGPNSSFRNIDQQNMMFKQYGAGQAARPGRSNHGFGLSIDLTKDEAWEWFVKNSSKYGFKQLNSTNERHHFDYTGNVAEYSGKQKVMGDGSVAPPSTQGSPEEQEEPEAAVGGEGSSSTPGGSDVDSSSDSIEGALKAINTGISDIFGA